MYNNPQSYVKYVKLEREIAKLVKQAESTKENISDTNKIEDKFTDTFKIPNSTYINILIDGLFVIFNIVSLYYFKGTYLTIDNKHTGNIVFDYFTSKDHGCIQIPINVVFFLEGLFIHKIMSMINKIIS